MTARVATRRWERRKVLGIPACAYDLSVPFQGHDALVIFHRKGANWIHPLDGKKVGPPLGNHPDVDDPDVTMQELGYFVRQMQ